MGTVLRFLGSSIFIVFLTAFLNYAVSQVSRYSNPLQDTVFIPYTHSIINIDGSLDDWESYTTRIFSDTNLRVCVPEGYFITSVYPELDSLMIRVPLSRNRCMTHLCWDKNNLYIAFIVNDMHLLGQWIGESDNPYIYLNDAVEVYIDSKNDSKSRMDINDYQFIVDIHNQVTAMKGTISTVNIDTLAVPKESGQNLLFKSAVNVTGKINGINDTAGRYIMEIGIPFLTIGMEPTSGDRLRISLGVEDADFIYADLTDPKDIGYNWAFDWAGYNDFGYPQTWRSVVLTGGPSWYERVSEHYRNYWLPLVISIILLCGAIISVLFVYFRKSTRLPTIESLMVKKHLFLQEMISPEGEVVSHNGRIIQDSIEYIRSHIHDPLRSEDLARHLSVSVRTLQRITREELNCTPTGLISIVRLRHAARYLFQGKGNISEAAFESGFSDPGYFSRLFKQYFGMSPGEYLSSDNKHLFSE